MSVAVELNKSGSICLVFAKRERDGRGGPALKRTVAIPLPDEEVERVAFDLLKAKQRKAGVA